MTFHALHQMWPDHGLQEGLLQGELCSQHTNAQQSSEFCPMEPGHDMVSRKSQRRNHCPHENLEASEAKPGKSLVPA